MPTIPEALAVALQHHQAGRLKLAEQLYRQILQVEPNHADALHFLGVVACQVGRYEDALDHISRAIGVRESTAGFHYNLGKVYEALSNLRSSLRDRMQASPLTDAARFARGIEAAYREMWQGWCKTQRL